MKKLTSIEKGKKFYEMRLTGLTNMQIAARCGELPYVVAARISQYRKTHDMPPLPKAKKKIKAPMREKVGTQSFRLVTLTDGELREKNHEEATRRDDGVLECPKRYCEGYGIGRRERL